MPLTRRELFAAAAAALPAGAQTRQEKGQQLVERALEALGGPKFLAIHNQIASGRAYSFYRSQLRGLARITVYDRFEPPRADMPDDWLPVSRKEVYTEKGDYYALFLNGKGWEVTFQGARPQPEDVMQRYRVGVRRDFFFFLRYRLEEKGLYYYHPGMEIVDNTPTDAVEITDAEGETLTVYLRQSDGLPARSLYTRRDPKTRIPFEEQTVWSKYRPVGGAVLPWNVRRERDGEAIYEQFATDVQTNVSLKREVFELPRGVRVLDSP